MQLHPHFLFNTLHAVSMLNFTDVDAANRMLVQQSDLLRITLENSGEQEVGLRHELDFLRRYLQIEQTRFHDRLSVDIEVDAKLIDAFVPNLILQPLVENAIRHGVGRLARGGRIRVRALRNGNELILEVLDDGAGLPEGFAEVEVIGQVGASSIERAAKLNGIVMRATTPPASCGVSRQLERDAGIGLSNTRARLHQLYGKRQRFVSSCSSVAMPRRAIGSSPTINTRSYMRLLENAPAAAASGGPKQRQRIVVRDAGRVMFVRPGEIDWIDAAGNYVQLHVGKDKHVLRETMAGLEARLDVDRFIRISRSVIVNPDRVKEIQPLYNGSYVFVLTSGAKLESSRRYRQKLAALLSDA